MSRPRKSGPPPVGLDERGEEEEEGKGTVVEVGEEEAGGGTIAFGGGDVLRLDGGRRERKRTT